MARKFATATPLSHRSGGRQQQQQRYPAPAASGVDDGGDLDGPVAATRPLVQHQYRARKLLTRSWPGYVPK